MMAHPLQAEFIPIKGRIPFMLTFMALCWW